MVTEDIKRTIRLNVKKQIFLEMTFFKQQKSIEKGEKLIFIDN